MFDCALGKGMTSYVSNNRGACLCLAALLSVCAVTRGVTILLLLVSNIRVGVVIMVSRPLFVYGV